MRTPPAPMLLTTGVLLAFWAYCLFDLAGADERDVRGFTKPVWLVVVVVGSVVGGLLWLLVVRPQHPRPR
ncbi:MAG: PLDc N-terminal domain-containing protein [Actinomycetes bacterium]